MKSIKTYVIPVFLLFIHSCQRQNSNPDVFRDKNFDTLQIIKRYPSQSVREIIYYESNKPSRNIGFNEQGDTLKIPQVLYVKPDSVFAYYPLKKYRYGQVCLVRDSLRQHGEAAILDTIDIKGSTMIKLRPGVINKETNKILGILRLAMNDDTYEYRTFEINVKADLQN